MELKEFVTKTLLAIENGVGDAQKDSTKNGIGPRDRALRDTLGYDDDEGRRIYEIEFEVGLTIDAGGAINVAWGHVGGSWGLKIGRKKEFATKAKFSVPLLFPERTSQKNNEALDLISRI